MRLGIPLSKAATSKFLATVKNESKMRNFYKLNCKSENPFECIQWTNKKNPVGIGNGYSLKNYSENNENFICLL